MTVYLDVSAGVNVSAGLGRYSRSLTQAMLPYFIEPPTLFFNYIKGRTNEIADFQHLKKRSIRLGYKAWRMAVWAGQLGHIPFNALVPHATLFHAHEHLLIPLRKVPTILTVHDLIFKLFPEHHKRLNHTFLNQAMPIFVKRATAIIAISEATKRDLMQYYQVPSEKITVIYEAAAPNFKPPLPEQCVEVRRRYRLPERFLIVVGTIEPRKNYSRLVQALVQLHQWDPDLKLVVVGSKGWLYEDFFNTINALNAADDVILPGYIPDEDLPALYGAATAMVMPSIYEGFGLPLLEAMACGVPVASSHAASLPELGGDVPIYFDPHDLDDMVEALKSLLLDEERQQLMRQRGPEQAARFSWDKAARETLQLYNQFATVAKFD